MGHNTAQGCEIAIVNCPDCDYVSEAEAFSSNGKCSKCHGTGYMQGLLESVVDDLAGGDQACETCDGTGKCQTCNGSGVVDD